MRFVLGRLKTRNDVLLDSLLCSGSIGKWFDMRERRQ